MRDMCNWYVAKFWRQNNPEEAVKFEAEVRTKLRGLFEESRFPALLDKYTAAKARGHE